MQFASTGRWIRTELLCRALNLRFKHEFSKLDSVLPLNVNMTFLAVKVRLMIDPYCMPSRYEDILTSVSPCFTRASEFRIQAKSIANLRALRRKLDQTGGKHEKSTLQMRFISGVSDGQSVSQPAKTADFENEENPFRSKGFGQSCLLLATGDKVED